MQYVIAGEKVRIFPLFLKKIGKGYEGTTYKYNGNVLKIHHRFPKMEPMKLETCEYMMNLSTERILLPKYSVCDKNNSMKGYILCPYIEKNLDIYKMNCHTFFDERSKVQDELEYLGNNYVSVSDFHLDNFIVSDKFYFVDPGMYVVHWKEMIKKNSKAIIINNLDYFDKFLYNEIIHHYIKDYVKNLNFCKEISKEIYCKFYGSNNFSIIEYLQQYITLSDSLEENIQKIITLHRN